MLTKQNQILNAAAACFLNRGFTETSMDDIVRQSGVVKQTVYNYFDNKELLFAAAVKQIISSMSQSDNFDLSWYKLDAQSFLEKTAKLQLKGLSNVNATAFFRLIVKECRRFPELQQVYAESIPKPFIEFVAKYLDDKVTIASTNALPDISLGHATAWCFRAALTGYATLSNLDKFLSYKLPNKTYYIDQITCLFAGSLYSKFDSFSKGEHGPGADYPKALGNVESKSSIRTFLASQELKPKKLEIVVAAIEVFSRLGFAEASMDEIGLSAKVSKQTLYKYFRGKDVLYSFVANCIFCQLQHKAFPSKDLLLDDYLTDYFSLLIDESSPVWLREYFRLVLGESQNFPHESAQLLIHVMDSARMQLEEMLRLKSNHAELDHLCLSIAIRGIIGSFNLLNQIYVVADSPVINERVLLMILQKLVITAVKSL